MQGNEGNRIQRKLKARAPALRLRRRYPPAAGSAAFGSARARIF